MPPQFVTVQEAAVSLRVPVATVRYWLAIRKLKGFKPGRHVLIRAEDLTSLVESSELGKLREDRARKTRAAVTAGQKVKLEVASLAAAGQGIERKGAA